MLISFHVLRVLASNCAGAGCDWFISLSLLLPLLILVATAATGLAAFSDASRERASSAWAIGLGVITLIGVLGPVASLAIFRDSPDRFIPVVTVLAALVPISALLYSFRQRGTDSARPQG
ncbi:MAG: hypothetical protein E6I84_13245 [Chloroflexi bacterium]|nr:MAG: hypothetical protein E6I84_13245 [Chloroflexota bacterium]